MKRKLMAIICSLLLSSLSWSVQAEEEWSCGDMKKFVDIMYEVATYLNDKPNFDENPKMEKDVDELVGLLKAIAKDEEIAAFSDAVNKLDKVWDKEEWHGDDIGDFRRALDSSVVNLERVYEKYCD